jgi:hypothetical protein
MNIVNFITKTFGTKSMKKNVGELKNAVDKCEEIE